MSEGANQDFISKLEIGRFLTFVISFTIVVVYQLQIPNQMMMNKSLNDLFFSNITDISLSNATLTRYNVSYWMDTQLYRGYNLNNMGTAINTDLMPITYLELQTTYIILDSETQVWSTQEEKDPQGIYQQYKYPYIIQFQPYQVYITSLDYNANKTSIGLIENLFLTSQTSSIKVAAAYYSVDMQMIVMIRMSFKVTNSGYVYVSKEIDSFRLQFYQSTQDDLRLGFEILFIILYLNYLYMEGYKLYDKLIKALKAYDEKCKKEEDKKKNSQQKKKTGQRRNAQAQAGIEGEDEESKPMNENESKLMDEASEAIKQQIKKQRERLQVILETILSHIQDIWSALDLTLLICLGIAISYYMRLVISPFYQDQLESLLSSSKVYSELFQNPAPATDPTTVNTLNTQFAQQADLFNVYRTLLSIPILIVWTKFLKYVIFIFKGFLGSYLKIIVNIVEYMVFYLILLVAILLAFSLFIYQIFGSTTSDLSNVGSALIYICGFMLGSNTKNYLYFQYDIGFTFLLNILLYVIIMLIIVNMFFVFVKAEYTTEQEILAKKTGSKDEKQGVNFIEETSHPIWLVYDLIEEMVVRLWFTLTYNKDQFNKYRKDKQALFKLNEREFKENVQTIDINIDFVNLINQQVEDLGNAKFIVEEEKEKIINRQKMDLIALIWKTILLLLILTLDFVLVQEFYDPSNAYLQQNSLKEKIMYTNNLGQMKFTQILQKQDLQTWIRYGVGSLTDETLLGRREIEFLYGKPQTEYSISSSLNKSTQIQQYQLKEFSFNNLERGYSINSFNIVVNNLIRVTIRRSTVVGNVDGRFRNIAKYQRQLFLSDPLDQMNSKYENTTDFSSNNFSDIGQLQLDYSSDEGYNSKGGYVLLLDPMQYSGLVQSLAQVGFLDTMASVVVQFVTFNPANQRGLSHVKIWFTVNQCGVVSSKQIEVDAIKKNTLQSFSEIAILLLSLILVLALLYYMTNTVKTLVNKNFSYNRWYNTYIMLSFTRSQLFIRERHAPELLRKALYLLDVSQLLNFLFLILMGSQIALIFYFFLNVNTLYSGAKIYGSSLQELLSSTILSLKPSMSNTEFFAMAQSLAFAQRLIGIFASCAIIILCLEILYLVSHNKDFQMLTNSIKYTLSHLLFVLFVMFGFIIAYSFMANLLMGPKYINFSTFYGSLIQLTDYIFYIRDMDTYTDPKNIIIFLIMLLPYILTARFIMLNLFFAITLKGYQESKTLQEKQAKVKSHEISLRPQEFITLSIEMFKFKENLPKVGSNQYISQIIKKFTPKNIFAAIKQNIRNESNVSEMKIWAEECAKEIKQENELRKPMSVACDEILQAYIELNNKGQFDILTQLNQDPPRKLIEYELRWTYFDYFREFIYRLDEFNLFFQTRNTQIKLALESKERSRDQLEIMQLTKLENQLEENLQLMTYIRKELLSIGYDIDIEGNVQKSAILDQFKEQRKKKKMFNNVLFDAVSSKMDQSSKPIEYEEIALKNEQQVDILKSSKQQSVEQSQQNTPRQVTIFSKPSPQE